MLATCASVPEETALAPRTNEPYCAKLYKRFNEKERVYEWVCIEKRFKDLG
jgi:hypothetical protein